MYALSILVVVFVFDDDTSVLEPVTLDRSISCCLCLELKFIVLPSLPGALEHAQANKHTCIDTSHTHTHTRMLHSNTRPWVKEQGEDEEIGQTMLGRRKRKRDGQIDRLYHCLENTFIDRVSKVSQHGRRDDECEIPYRLLSKLERICHNENCTSWSFYLDQLLKKN